MLWWGCGTVENHYDKLEGSITKDRVRFPEKIPLLLRWAGSSVWSKILTGNKQLWLGSRGLCAGVGSTGSFLGSMKTPRTCSVLTDLITSMDFSYHLLEIMQSILIDVKFLAGSKEGRGLCRIANIILTTRYGNMWYSEINWMERACPACGSFCLAIPDNVDYLLGSFWAVLLISELKNPPSTYFYLLTWAISSGLLI